MNLKDHRPFDCRQSFGTLVLCMVLSIMLIPDAHSQSLKKIKKELDVLNSEKQFLESGLNYLNIESTRLENFIATWSKLLAQAVNEPPSNKNRGKRIVRRTKKITRYTELKAENRKSSRKFKERYLDLESRILKQELAARKLKMAEFRAKTPSKGKPTEADLSLSPNTRGELYSEIVIGNWLTTDGAKYQIDNKYPHVRSRKNTLTLQTRKGRTWDGVFYPGSSGEPGYKQTPRVTFTYKPKADELDKQKLPPWVRAAVAGKLEWRMELDAPEPIPSFDRCGNSQNAKIQGVWYPGEITYTSDRSNGAWVTGDGDPIPIEMKHDIEENSDLYTPPGDIINVNTNIWLQKLDAETYADAKLSRCSCDNIELKYAFSQTHNKNTNKTTNKRIYDLNRSSTGRKQARSFKIPPMEYNGLPRDQVCLVFTYPKKLAYYSHPKHVHDCEVKIVANFPNTKFGKYLNNHPFTGKLYSVSGMGGDGLDGRKTTENRVCAGPLNTGEGYGPAGKRGKIQWSVRRSRLLSDCNDIPPIVQTCEAVNLIVE